MTRRHFREAIEKGIEQVPVAGPIKKSKRLSCHSFWAPSGARRLEEWLREFANDFDREKPLGVLPCQKAALGLQFRISLPQLNLKVNELDVNTTQELLVDGLKDHIRSPSHRPLSTRWLGRSFEWYRLGGDRRGDQPPRPVAPEAALSGPHRVKQAISNLPIERIA